MVCIYGQLDLSFVDLDLCFFHYECMFLVHMSECACIPAAVDVSLDVRVQMLLFLKCFVLWSPAVEMFHQMFSCSSTLSPEVFCSIVPLKGFVETLLAVLICCWSVCLRFFAQIYILFAKILCFQFHCKQFKFVSSLHIYFTSSGHNRNQLWKSF